MTDFCIQIHIDRAPGLDLAAVRNACAVLAKDKALVRCFAVIEEGCIGHVDLMFATDRPAELWTALTQSLFNCCKVGPGLRSSAVVMCEGAKGWDDFRLLHHFDCSHRLDVTPDA